MTPTSVTLGKSCPLAIICVPTSTSSSRAANLASSARDGAAAADGVAIDAADARAGKERAHLGLDPLGAEPELLEIRPGALAADLRQRRRVVAVVAARAARGLVDGQRHAAVRALERLAALPAEDDRREAAAVEQDDRLLAALEARRHRLAQTAR